MKELKEKNLNPYYNNGNEFGTGNEAIPVNAYYKVYKEICNQEQKSNIQYDYIFCGFRNWNDIFRINIRENC